jgi:hypothetical protein
LLDRRWSTTCHRLPKVTKRSSMTLNSRHSGSIWLYDIADDDTGAFRFC